MGYIFNIYCTVLINDKDINFSSYIQMVLVRKKKKMEKLYTMVKKCTGDFFSNVWSIEKVYIWNTHVKYTNCTFCILQYLKLMKTS